VEGFFCKLRNCFRMFHGRHQKRCFSRIACKICMQTPYRNHPDVECQQYSLSGLSFLDYTVFRFRDT
jgi:hypothetical protein